MINETSCCGSTVTSFAVILPVPSERTRCDGRGQIMRIQATGTGAYPNGGDWTIWEPDHELAESLTGWA